MLSRIVITCIAGAICAGVHFFCDKKQTESETRSDAHASTEDDGKAEEEKQDLHKGIDLAHQYDVSNAREENILSTTSQKVESESEGKSTTIHRSEKKTETGSRNIEQEEKETSTSVQKTRKKAEASSRNMEQEPETRSDAHASTEDDGKAGAEKQDLLMVIDLAHQYGVSNVREENILSTTSQKVDLMDKDRAAQFIKWINLAPDGDIFDFASSSTAVASWTGSRNIEQEGKETSTTVQKTRKKAEASYRNIEQEPETRSDAHASTEDDRKAEAEKQDLHMGIDLALQYGVFNVREENILSTTSQKVEIEREGKSTTIHRSEKKTETGSRNIEQEGEETSTTAQKTRKKAEASYRNIEQVGEKVSTAIKKNEEKEEKWIKHYSSKHHILLVGEGDFSFSACLARAFVFATGMVATSLDSEKELKSKYSTAEKNLQALEKRGCMILHGVDAHTMSKHSVLKTKKFDRIIYNFPHAGFHGRESDSWQISSHQMLVRGFFRSARKMLRAKGQVHVTHKTTQPYNEWQVEILGKEQGLVLIGRPQFSKRDYRGYDNKRGDGSRSNETFPVGEAATFKFRLG